MSKLSELIAKSKEKANVSASVLQPETKQEEKAVAQEAIGAERIVSTGNEIRELSTTENDKILGETGPVENTPPPGLKGIDLIRWKKNNASKPTQSVQPIKQVQPVSVAPSPVPVLPAGPTVQDEKPVREISASQKADAEKSNSGSANLEELRVHLTYLANNIEHKDMVAQVVRTIGLQLQNAPELVPQMSHAEVDLVVRGFRRAYTVAARKKSEIKEAKQAKVKDTSEISKLFADAGLGNIFVK